MKRVAYLTNQYPSPSHSFIRREIAGLERAGWQVHRFTHRRARAELVEPADLAERDRTEVLLDRSIVAFGFALLSWLFRSPLRTLSALALTLRMARSGDGRRVAHLAYFAMACVLARRLRQLDCHHVHVHFGTNPAAVALLAHRLGGLRYSVTFHGPEEFDPGQRLNLADKIADASFIALVSNAGHRRLSAQFPQFAARFRLVPCGLDDEWFETTPHEWNGSRDLVCVARLDAQKNPLLLLAAARILLDRGVAFRLVMAGDGGLRPAVEARIVADGLAGHVVLAGWQTQAQVMRHLHASRALVLSSEDEGLPVVIMEAFALGLPAIAPDVGGVGELVETGATGWLVPRGDAQKLADAMQACLAAPVDELRRLGKAALDRVQGHRIQVAVEWLARGFSRNDASSGRDPTRPVTARRTRGGGGAPR